MNINLFFITWQEHCSSWSFALVIYSPKGMVGVREGASICEEKQEFCSLLKHGRGDNKYFLHTNRSSQLSTIWGMLASINSRVLWGSYQLNTLRDSEELSAFHLCRSGLQNTRPSSDWARESFKKRILCSNQVQIVWHRLRSLLGLKKWKNVEG